MKPDCQTFDKTWRDFCHLVPISKGSCAAITKYHYLHKWPGVVTLSLAMMRQEEFLGIIVFALPPRETSKRYGGETWELARLWIDDKVPQNGETWLIGKAIRFIRKNHQSIKVIVSYADPSAGHSGTIYKAANWIADGRTDQERKTPRFDYACAETGKRFSRRGHVPAGITIKRIPRVSKYRFIYRL